MRLQLAILFCFALSFQLTAFSPIQLAEITNLSQVAPSEPTKTDRHKTIHKKGWLKKFLQKKVRKSGDRSGLGLAVLFLVFGILGFLSVVVFVISLGGHPLAMFALLLAILLFVNGKGGLKKKGLTKKRRRNGIIMIILLSMITILTMILFSS